jgi:hypothetical protein
MHLTSHKRIALDMDDVMADALTVWLERYNQDFRTSITKADLLGKKLYDLVGPDRVAAACAYLDHPEFFVARVTSSRMAPETASPVVPPQPAAEPVARVVPVAEPRGAETPPQGSQASAQRIHLKHGSGADSLVVLARTPAIFKRTPRCTSYDSTSLRLALPFRSSSPSNPHRFFPIRS